MPPKVSKGKKPAPTASEKESSKPAKNPDKGKAKNESTQKVQNDESEKDKEIKALLLRVDCLEKNMNLKVFQTSSGFNIAEEDQLARFQDAFKSAEKELIMLKKGLPSSGNGNVPGTTDESSRLTGKIDILEKEIANRDMAIAGIQTKLDEANPALDEMRKQLRHSQESPRKTSAKSQPSDGNTPAKLAALETSIQSKDSEIKILKEQIKQLESAAKRQPSDGITPAKLAALETSVQSKDSEIQILKDKITQLETTASRQPSDGNEPAKTAALETSVQGKEMRILKEKITQLESTATHDSKSYAKLQEEMGDKNESIDELNKELKSMRNDMQQEKTKVDEIKKNHRKELEEKDFEIQRVQDEKDLQLKRLRDDTDSKIQRLQKEKDNEERLKQTWMDKVQELENKSERSKSAKERSDPLQALLKEKETEIRNKNDEIKRLKTKIQELENACHEAEVKLESKGKENKKLEDDFRQKLDDKDETINKLRREKHMETTAPVQTNIEHLQRDFRKATQEIEELKSRLSKMVGENLTTNNPNITDLSDENRPTKLAEIYSEIYDNEWTDAFEECEKQGKKEDTIIKELLEILETTEQYCREKAEEYLRYLKESASKLHAKASFQSGYTKEYLLKELRKSYAPSFADEVFSLFIKDKKKKFSKTPKLELYTKSCIRLCWLMNVQDPQVVLDVGKVPIKFDGDRYRTYTRNGTTMEYVVWPSMLLHAGGPILMKGVAQGK